MDIHIIDKLKQGDEKAFQYIYDCHYVLLCRFAYQLLNDSSLAEEIVDDTIFYLWEHRADIEITHSIRAYLMRAVRNRCLNELNSLAHRTELRFSSFMLPENVDFLNTIFVEREMREYYWMEYNLMRDKGLLWASNEAAVKTLLENRKTNPFVNMLKGYWLRFMYKSVRDDNENEQRELVERIYKMNKPQTLKVELVRL